ncbi:MAG TPA: methyltransferase domain-containing protein [bacterium]|nr:methyltransferase domain-containing protein [bacterium]HPG81647.1 methyltransferase domain-containing protein [bacterium]HPM57958.1 methyltransferase domain-containing protein [bacterium]
MLFDHFNLIARFYDRAIGPHEAEKLGAQLALPENGRLLDVAGGTGRVLSGLASWRGSMVLCDYAMGMLRQAQAKKVALPARSAAEQMPFADGRFERVLMVDALHHVADQPQTLHEMYRVLSPGGRMVIEEFDIRHWAIRIVALLEKIALMRSHFIPLSEIAGILQKAGAHVEIRMDGAARAWIVAEKPPTS